jgi:hypothetical protein
VHHKYKDSFEAALVVAKEEELQRELEYQRAAIARYDARNAAIAHRARGHHYHDRVSNWRD